MSVVSGNAAAKGTRIVLMATALLGCCLGLACDVPAESAFERGDSRIAPQQQHSLAAPDYDLEPVPCVPPSIPADTVDLVRLAELVPAEIGAEDEELQWLPGGIADVVSLPDGYAVVDRLNAEIIVLDRELGIRAIWGGKGPGPSEFQQPVAAASTINGDSLWVLDRQKRRVTVFDAAGDAVAHHTVRSSAEDLALTDNGTFLLANDVLGQSLLTDDDAVFHYLSEYTLDGEFMRESGKVTDADIGTRRFIFPGPNFVRVKAGGPHVAVIFPRAGVVTLRSDRRELFSLSTCLPEDVLEAYERQLKQTDPGAPFTQVSFPVVGDVHVNSDGSGHLLVATPTRSGYYHIDFFDARGRIYKVTLLESLDGRLPKNLRLSGADADSILGYSRSGTVGIYGETRSPRARR